MLATVSRKKTRIHDPLGVRSRNVAINPPQTPFFSLLALESAWNVNLQQKKHGPNMISSRGDAHRPPQKPGTSYAASGAGLTVRFRRSTRMLVDNLQRHPSRNSCKFWWVCRHQSHGVEISNRLAIVDEKMGNVPNDYSKYPMLLAKIRWTSLS